MNYIYLETFLGYLKIKGKKQIEKIEFVSKKQKDNANLFLEDVKKEFLNYFKNNKDFKDLKINDSKHSLFQKEVFRVLQQETKKEKLISYKKLAIKVKEKNYTRQVSSALSKNRFPFIIPCHRVIYSDGKIGNYSLGNNIKHALINFENNNLIYFKMVCPKWFNWQIMQTKCLLIPFLKLENNCISYLSKKKLVNIRFSNNFLYVNFESTLNKNEVKKEIIKMFNLKENYQAILNYFKNTDFSSLMTKCDFMNEFYWLDKYQHLIRIIIFQQLTSESAKKIYIKFLKLTSKKINKIWAFPEINKISKVSLVKLKEIGLTNIKAKAIKSLTSKVLSNKINLNGSKEVVKKLLEIKGIGPWTINIFRMYSLKETNLFPIKDLGLQKGIKSFFNLKHNPNETEILKYLKNIKKYRSFLANALWDLKERI